MARDGIQKCICISTVIFTVRFVASVRVTATITVRMTAHVFQSGSVATVMALAKFGTGQPCAFSPTLVRGALFLLARAFRELDQ